MSFEDRNIIATRPLFSGDSPAAEIGPKGFKVELADEKSHKISYVHIIPPDENSPGSITFTIPDKQEFSIAMKECQAHADMLNKRMTVHGDSITLSGVDPVHASLITRGLEQQGALSQGTADKFHDKLLAAFDDWRQAYGNPKVLAHAKAETAKLQDFYRETEKSTGPPTMRPPEPTAAAKNPVDALGNPKPAKPHTGAHAPHEKKLTQTPSLKAFCADVEEEYNAMPKSAEQAAGNPQVKKLMKFAAQTAGETVKKMDAVAHDINVAAAQKAQAAIKSDQKLAEALQKATKGIS